MSLVERRAQDRVVASLDRLDRPTLVIHGADDRLVPTASSERLAELPGVTRRVLPGLRHEVHNEPEGPRSSTGSPRGSGPRWVRRPEWYDPGQLNTASGERMCAESVARPQTRGT